MLRNESMARHPSGFVVRTPLLFAFSFLLFFLTAGAEEAGGKKEKTAEKKDNKDKPRAGKPEVSPEYKGAALPLETGETASEIRRAEELFSFKTLGHYSLDSPETPACNDRGFVSVAILKDPTGC